MVLLESDLTTTGLLVRFLLAILHRSTLALVSVNREPVACLSLASFLRLASKLFLIPGHNVLPCDSIISRRPEVYTSLVPSHLKDLLFWDQQEAIWDPDQDASQTVDVAWNGHNFCPPLGPDHLESVRI